MLTNMLETDVTLYKAQFDQYMLAKYHNHIVDRLSLDLDGLKFRMGYMAKHNLDLDQIPLLKEQFIETSKQLRDIFSGFLYDFLTEYIGFPEECDYADIIDFYSTDMDLNQDTVTFQFSLLSDSTEYLEYVDQRVHAQKIFNMYPNQFFRFSTDSYNDAIAKAYPELFENRHTEIGKGADGDVFVHNFTFQTTESCSLQCTYCMPAGTDVVMSDMSLKPIEELKIGDTLLGTDEFPVSTERQLKVSTVVNTFSHDVDGYYVIAHAALRKPIKLTAEHPVWSNRVGWVPVSELRKEDEILILAMDPSNYYPTNTNGTAYITGYFTGAFMCGGYSIATTPAGEYTRYFNRFAVNDIDIMNRMRSYAELLGIYFLSANSMYNCKRSEYNKIQDLIASYRRHDQFCDDPDYVMGFLAGVYDMEGSIENDAIRIVNTNDEILNGVERAFEFLGIAWKYDSPRNGVNKPVKTIRAIGGSYDVAKIILSIKPACVYKGVESFVGTSPFTYLKGYSITYVNKPCTVYNIETDTHTYIAGKLVVHNCYQFNKSPMNMKFETAKEFIDKLLNDEYGYINRYNSPAIIIEFIGGEPLLQINLTRKIYEYFLMRCYELQHPWFTMHRLSICSNGLQYFDPNVQAFFRDYSHQISFNISIDGNKALHDACRIQPTGEGSYDIAMTALNHYNRTYSKERNSKMTLAPANISYLFDSVVDFIQHGMTNINLNCVFEEGWTVETAKTEYEQLKKLADYLIDNDLEHLYVAIFRETPEGPMDKYSDGNHCGGLGSMLAMRPNGQFYPCIRYMPTSVGDNVKDLCIGTVQDGMVGREEDSEILQMMDNITRRSQSNDICYDCPIGNSCAWCFRAGTVIATLSGDIPIEKIQPGDMVRTQTGFHAVKHVINRIARPNETILLKADGIFPVYTTSEHPFWAKQVQNTEQGRYIYKEADWVNVGKLGIHDQIQLLDGSWTEITEIKWLHEEYTVYNFSVVEDPTYYANGALVHNCSALSHTVYGTPGKRPMFICIQMIAEALANVYYWNTLAIKHPEYQLLPRINMVPDSWARLVVDEEELTMLKTLESWAYTSYRQNLHC